MLFYIKLVLKYLTQFRRFKWRKDSFELIRNVCQRFRLQNLTMRLKAKAFQYEQSF